MLSNKKTKKSSVAKAKSVTAKFSASSNSNITNVVSNPNPVRIDYENLCTASFGVIKDLPIYELANSLSSSSETINELTLLNTCVRILQEQILQTGSLNPTGTITKDTDPLKQQNVFCFLKKKKELNNRNQFIFELNK